METSVMDKKILPRGPQLPFKNGQDSQSKEYGSKKSGSQYARKREYDRQDTGRRPVAGRGWRAGQRYVRPREKTGCEVEVGSVVIETGSLYHGGRKKQNITHLMNWWGPNSRDRGGGQQRGWVSRPRGGMRTRRYSSHTPKYSKEHYLQANCQFVVVAGEDYSVYLSDPDLLVEWRLVEEVRLHVSEAPSCPICLYPPTAAKVTPCGHIFCYPCILHYLSLSDQTWRKCPICYAEILKENLKSVLWIVHDGFNPGQEIELQLMRRERDSLVAVPAAAYTPEIVYTANHLGHHNAASPFTKLLVASNTEIGQHIIARERKALEQQMEEEGDQPEACFIQEALSLIQLREELLYALIKVLDTFSLDSLEHTQMHCTIVEDVAPGHKLDDDLNTLLSSMDDLTLAPEENFKNKIRLENEFVTADDLDISKLQPYVQNSHEQFQKNVPKSTYYFYQANNGAHIYLHALNVNMLVTEYGTLDKCPPVIKGKILEKESTSMTEDLRQRLRYLRHLPVTCPFEVVELLLRPPILSKDTLAEFNDQLETRQRKRNKRAKAERRIEKRNKEEEDRIMGRSKGANINMGSFRHFPTFSDQSVSTSEPLVVEVKAEPKPKCGSYEDTSECSMSPGSDVPCSSSSDNTSSVSFAQMIRDGQNRVPSSRSEPANFTSNGTWPTLGSRVTYPTTCSPTAVPAWTQGGIDVSTGKLKGGVPKSGRTRCDTECSEESLEEAAPPTYQQTFSDAFDMALNAAAKKAQANDSSAKGGRKGKKKKKGIVLLSSGAF